MANKEDAAETAKEVVRQLIKYRFWIAIGFAALFAVIAYFMGAGPVQAKADKERKDILAAEKNVQAYNSLTKPNEQYKPIVVEKTAIVTKDVNKAWKELYDRQAPLLTWPESVKDRFRKWGREWPKDVNPGQVDLAIVDYIYAYPAYVDLVYKTFKPFDYETGKGIVAAPMKEELLRPAQFTIEDRPPLGKVWSAQERLWIQRTLLEVVDEVNKKSKDWDSAIIKQVEGLEVGNPMAQDQRSAAAGDQLEKAPEILAPGQEAAEEGSASAASPMSGMMPGGPGKGGGRGGMMGGMGSMGGMRGGGSGGAAGAGAQYDDTIYYVKSSGDNKQYKVLPVSMTVLIDQEHVQDLLVELENSPMSIRVMDFDLERPPARVTKPEKGEQRTGMGAMGSMGSMGMMRGMMGQQGFGGMASQMRGQMMGMGQMSRMGAMGGMGGMRAGGMGGMMGAGSSTKKERAKVDVNPNRKKEREQKAEEIAKQKGVTLFDPYFNIVQVTVYGQARFFNPPPSDAEAQPSLGDVTASPSTPAAGGAPPAAPAPTGTGAPPAAAEKTGTPATAEKTGMPATMEKPGTPAQAEKSGAADANGKAATPRSDAAPAPAGPEAAKPAAAKPAAPAADSAKPDAKGAAVKK